jgi:hypothetical protein
MITSLASILLLLFDAVPAPVPDDADVRRSVERSLPFLEKEGVSWIEKRQCLSCHQVTFMLWAHREAQAKGIEVDGVKLAGWSRWSLHESRKRREKLKLIPKGLEALATETPLAPETRDKLAVFSREFGGDTEEIYLKELATVLTPEELEPVQALLLTHAQREQGDGGGIDTVAQLLMAEGYGSSGGGDDGFRASTRALLLKFQQGDGTWKPGGQIGNMNRSPAEAAQITTMWSALALLEESDAAAMAGVTRAWAAVNAVRAGKNTEWHAVRLLLARKLGDEEVALAALRRLLARQLPDGSWPAISGGAGDAFATGQVLYALSRACGRDAAQAIQRGRQRLLETQAEDGSWPVPPAALTSPSSSLDRLKKLEPIYRYWGSAWATIGLASTLGSKP